MRRVRAALLTLVLAITSGATIAIAIAGAAAGGAAAAGASSTAGGEVCQGYGGCNSGPFTSHGYQSHEWTSYWRMTAGDECTNYVAYVESAIYHVAEPSYLLGDAGSWPTTAAAHGVVVNNTPSVGAVAEFDPGSAGIPWPGHVAVVEQVGPHDSWIVVSQQHLASDADGYDWMRINPGNPGSSWQQWPSHFIHFVPVRPPAPPPPAERLAAALATPGLAGDGGFDPADGRSWHVSPNSSFAVWRAGGATAPYQGHYYGVISATHGGGGIFQEINQQVTRGEGFCADAEVVTNGRRIGGWGQLLLFFKGGPRGTRDQVSAVTFGPLPGGNGWRPVTTCLTAISPHTTIRIQVLPAPHGPALGIDAVDVHQSLAADGGFDSNGGGGWRVAPKTRFGIYSRRHGLTVPSEGDGFGATNTSADGGGIYQDIHIPVAAGTSYCADAEVTTVGGPGGGAQGALALWLLGGSNHAQNRSAFSMFGSLSAGRWSPVSTCVTATAAYSVVRVQFYDLPGTPTLGIDAVDVHSSLVSDGAFSPGDGGSWRAWPHSNLATYGAPWPGSKLTAPYEGDRFAATNTTVLGGGIYEDVKAEVLAGQSYCASAEVVTDAHGGSGASGLMQLSFLGGGGLQFAGVSFGALPGGNGWSRVTTCLTATSNHTDVRIAFEPGPRSPTLGIDTVDLR